MYASFQTTQAAQHQLKQAYRLLNIDPTLFLIIFETLDTF
jgi:hypothetical protein